MESCQGYGDGLKGRASFYGIDGEWKGDWNRESMRLAKKLSLCPGGRPVRLGLRRAKYQFPGEVWREPWARHCVETIHLSGVEGGQASAGLCVCVGASLWQPSLSKIVPRCWPGLQLCF